MQHIHDVVEVFGEIVEIDVGEGGVRVHCNYFFTKVRIVAEVVSRMYPTLMKIIYLLYICLNRTLNSISMLIGVIGLGGAEIIILLLIFIALPIINSVVFYRLGKKAGYNQGKAEAFEKQNADRL